MRREEMLKQTMDHLMIDQKLHDKINAIQDIDGTETNVEKSYQASNRDLSSFSRKKSFFATENDDFLNNRCILDQTRFLEMNENYRNRLETDNEKEGVLKDQSSNNISDTLICKICYNIIPNTNTQHTLPCKHLFCFTCHHSYLDEKISNNQVLSF